MNLNKCFLYFFTLCLELYSSHIVSIKQLSVPLAANFKLLNFDFNPGAGEFKPIQLTLFGNGTNCFMVTSLMGFFLHITHLGEHEKFWRQIIADIILQYQANAATFLYEIKGTKCL